MLSLSQPCPTLLRLRDCTILTVRSSHRSRLALLLSKRGVSWNSAEETSSNGRLPNVSAGSGQSRYRIATNNKLASKERRVKQSHSKFPRGDGGCVSPTSFVHVPCLRRSGIADRQNHMLDFGESQLLVYRNFFPDTVRRSCWQTRRFGLRSTRMRLHGWLFRSSRWSPTQTTTSLPLRYVRLLCRGQTKLFT